MLDTASVQDSWTLRDITPQRGDSLTHNDVYDGARSTSTPTDDSDKNTTNSTNIGHCESAICSKDIATVAISISIQMQNSLQTHIMCMLHTYQQPAKKPS